MLRGLSLGVVGMRWHGENTAHLTKDALQLVDSPVRNHPGSRSPPLPNVTKKSIHTKYYNISYLIISYLTISYYIIYYYYKLYDYD